MPESKPTLEEILPYFYRRHPWHGVPLGEDAPAKVTAFVEIVPTDTVKYELDKATGLLKIDRPQKFSNVYPTLYGFLPQTYCGDETGRFCTERTGRPGIRGDGDPLDVCILCERDISHGDILVQAIPIGGLRMIDQDQADDKIVAVLEGDAVYGRWREISDSPPELVERLRHYFLTYKQTPGSGPSKVEITHVYGREEALEVIRRTQADYERDYGHLRRALSEVSGRIRG
ncbi:MAG: inorganic pyrophosphatase [Alphaproteobacteria bacterium]